MARSLAIFVIAALLGAGLYWLTHPKPSVVEQKNNLTTWQEYIAPSGQFRVLMPNLPHHSVDSKKDPKTGELRDYEIFITATDSGNVYSINLISFPQTKETVFDDKFLDRVVNEMLMSNPKNVLKRVDKTTYKQGQAIDFSVEADDMTLNGRAFLRNKTLYVLSTTSPQKDNLNQSEFDLFLNSFQMTGNPLPKAK